jgi:hypothetical protein
LFLGTVKDMNQRQLNREVAKSTGESISTIAQRGFSLAPWIPSQPFTPAFCYVDFTALQTAGLIVAFYLNHSECRDS